MKFLFLPLMCLAVFFTAACMEKTGKSLTGVYQTSFESGIISPDADNEKCEPPLKMIGDICAEPYTAKNTLGLFQNETGDMNFAAELSFFNGHTCSVSGVAKKQPNGWLYETEESSDEKCKLMIETKSDKIIFTTQEGYDCQYYCGARGSLNGAEFPLSSKTKQTISRKEDLDCISSMEEPCKQPESKE